MNTHDRAPRRKARLPCRLELDGRPFTATVLDISRTGLGIQLASDPAPPRVQPGSSVSVEVQFADGSSATCACEVAWIDDKRYSATGGSSTAMGLRLGDLEPAVRARLAMFVASFRYAVLLVDDEPQNLQHMENVLGSEFRVISCPSARSAMQVLEREEVAVVVSDYHMPEMDGFELCKAIEECYPLSAIQKIVITTAADSPNLHDLINFARVFQLVDRPFKPRDFLQLVRRAADAYSMSAENQRLQLELERANRRLQAENADLRRQVAQMASVPSIVSTSPAMHHLLDVVKQVATTDATVLLFGETGTGKELLARAVHNLSPRASKPFVAVNCAALPESLVEAELFGHEKGAFTGATARRIGRFELASEGTLFIDELGDLPLSVQVKLLRVLQEGTFERLGGATPVETHARIVAATHRDLEAMVEQGRFREDLYYRLSVVPLHVPPLRERPEDILPLAEHYLEHFQTVMRKSGIRLSDRMRQALLDYAWPGNVRELINVVERAVALADANRVLDMTEIRGHPGRRLAAMSLESSAGSLKRALSEFERKLIAQAMTEAGNNCSRAAQRLGISRQALSVKLRKQSGGVQPRQ